MMYDELIELMRYCANDNPVCEKSEACPFYNQAEEDYGYYFCVERMLKQAANAIEELQKQLREEKVDNVNLTGRLAEEHAKHLWIPVTERLPEEDGKYLTVHTLNSIPPKPWIEVCWFAKNLKKVDKYDFPKKKSGFYKSDSEYGFYEVSGITHWMPLPEPPKEKT